MLKVMFYRLTYRSDLFGLKRLVLAIWTEPVREPLTDVLLKKKKNWTGNMICRSKEHLLWSKIIFQTVSVGVLSGGMWPWALEVRFLWGCIFMYGREHTSFLLILCHQEAAVSTVETNISQRKLVVFDI